MIIMLILGAGLLIAGAVFGVIVRLNPFAFRPAWSLAAAISTTVGAMLIVIFAIVGRF